MSEPTRFIQFANGQKFDVSDIDLKELDDPNSRVSQWARGKRGEWGAYTVKTPEPERMINLPFVGMRGQTGMVQAPESSVRTATNIIGEVLPMFTPGGLISKVPRVATAIGIGSRTLGPPLGRKLISEPIQRALGVEPEEFGVKEAAALGSLSALGEGSALLASKGGRSAVGGLFRRFGKATPEVMERVGREYAAIGLERQPLSVLRESQVLRGVYGFLQKSLWSSGIMLDDLARMDADIAATQLRKTAKSSRLPGRTNAFPEVTTGYKPEEVGYYIGRGPRREFETEMNYADNLYADFRRQKPKNLQGPVTQVRKVVDNTLYKSAVEITTAAGGTKLANIAKKIDRAMMGNGSVVFEDAERLRSFVGKAMSKTIDPKERGELRVFYRALTEDMEQMLIDGEAAGSVSSGALDAWNAAKSTYRKAMEKDDDFYAKIYAKVVPEDITYEIKNYMLREGGKSPQTTRLREVFGTLTDSEKEPFQQYFIRQSMFSPNGEFLSLDGLYQNSKEWGDDALDIVFGVDTPIRKEIGGLAKVAKHYHTYGPRQVDPSTLMTARELLIPGLLGGAMGAATYQQSGGNWWLTFMAALAYPVSVNRMAALMSSPNVVRWMRDGAKLKPGQLASHIGALSGIAAYEQPEVREGILELIQNMEAAMEEPGPRQLPGMGLIAGR